MCQPLLVGADDYLTAAMVPTQLLQRIKKSRAPLVVDVRKPPEYAIAHIPGAVNIPLDELSNRLEETRSETGVLIYCFNGSRTREAEHILLDHNIDDVYHLEGTFEKWLQDSYPVEKGGVKKKQLVAQPFFQVFP